MLKLALKPDLDSWGACLVAWASILEVGQLQIKHSNGLSYYLGLLWFIYSNVVLFEAFFPQFHFAITWCVCVCVCSFQLRGLQDRLSIHVLNRRCARGTARPVRKLIWYFDINTDVSYSPLFHLRVSKFQIKMLCDMIIISLPICLSCWNKSW